MNPFTKLSYLVLIIFPLLLMLIMFMAIVAVGAAGHGSGDTEFFWVMSAVGILNAVLLRNCMRKPYKLRSRKLRWATILLTAVSVLVSLFLLVGSFYSPEGFIIGSVMFVVALLTIICGVVVIVDNSKAVRN
jgi:hypothetical protein